MRFEVNEEHLDITLKITASIGMARNQSGDQDMQAIQQQADTAMYVAKKGGRNRVSCFAETVTEDVPVASGENP